MTIFFFILYFASAFAKTNVLVCNTGMEFTYTSSKSNYSPYDLCKEHGGVKIIPSEEKINVKYSFDLNKKETFNKIFNYFIWFSPYGIKPLYFVDASKVENNSFLIEDKKDYITYYSAGFSFLFKYAYFDLSLQSYSSNVYFDRLYENIFYSKNSFVLGSKYAFGLSIPLVYKEKGKLLIFTGIYSEHSIRNNFNTFSLGTSYGIKAQINNFFIETISSDPFASFDFVPSYIYSSYKPDIVFKLGIRAY